MDRTTQDEIKAHLTQTSDHYRDLLGRHNEYSRLVGQLEAKPGLSAEEELEEHRLKKLKLHLKDEMEQMVSEYSFQPAG